MVATSSPAGAGRRTTRQSRSRTCASRVTNEAAAATARTRAGTQEKNGGCSGRQYPIGQRAAGPAEVDHHQAPVPNQCREDTVVRRRLKVAMIELRPAEKGQTTVHRQGIDQRPPLDTSGGARLARPT